MRAGSCSQRGAHKFYSLYSCLEMMKLLLLLLAVVPCVVAAKPVPTMEHACKAEADVMTKLASQVLTGTMTMLIDFPNQRLYSLTDEHAADAHVQMFESEDVAEDKCYEGMVINYQVMCAEADCDPVDDPAEWLAGLEYVSTGACPSVKGMLADKQCDKFTDGDEFNMYFVEDTNVWAGMEGQGATIAVTSFQYGPAPLPPKPEWCLV